MTNYANEWNVYLREGEGSEDSPVRVEADYTSNGDIPFLSFWLSGGGGGDADVKTAMLPSQAVRLVTRVVEGDETSAAWWEQKYRHLQAQMEVIVGLYASKTSSATGNDVVRAVELALLDPGATEGK